MMKPVKIDYIPRYTYNDYIQWEGRWELIEGIPYAMTPFPVIEHQVINGNIYIQLVELLRECEKCKALLPVDWKIDDDTVVQPDIVVVCGEVSGKYLDKPPIMIFEMLSPATAFKDRNIKYKIYESQDVKYFIIVDIIARVAEVFFLGKRSYKKVKDAQDDIIPFDLEVCTLEFDFGRIWKI